MKFTAEKIAEFLNGNVEGDKKVFVSNISKIEDGGEATLSFLANPKYTKYIYETTASVVIVNNDFVAERQINATLIRVPDAYKAFASILELYNNLNKKNRTGISENTHIHKTAKIGENVYIEPFVFIDKDTIIGNNVTILSNTHISEKVKIDDNTEIYSGVNIYKDTKIGKNCVIHSGTIIGSDGFGFVPQMDTEFKKIPQLGNVIIEDNVEVGANTTIDRATIGSTIIRAGVKLDNLIQIAHNVEVGENTVIAAQTAISGSTKIGKNCMIGGQVGFAGHLVIADGVKIGAQSGVHKSIKKKNAVMQGTPVTGMRNWYRTFAIINMLPDLKRKIDKILYDK